VDNRITNLLPEVILNERYEAPSEHVRDIVANDMNFNWLP
jgi:hypothetical protein